MKKPNKLKILITKSCYLVFLFSLLFPNIVYAKNKYEFISWKMPVQRFSEFGVSPETMADLVGDGQFVVNLKPQGFVSWDVKNNENRKYENQKVAYVVSVIRAPIEDIRELVWDIASQGEYSPLLRDTETLMTEGNKRIGSYKQLIKMPVITLKSKFVVQQEKFENGDIAMVLIDKGDVGSMFQNWEFYALDESSTLVVLSGYQDISTASFSYKLMVESEPALGKVFPLLSVYERIRRFKIKAEADAGTEKPKDSKKYDIRNANMFVGDNPNLKVNDIKTLSNLGTLLFFQEPRTLEHNGITADIIQVNAVKYFPYQKKDIAHFLNNFKNISEFNEITYGWEGEEITKSKYGFLDIRTKFGPIVVPVNIFPVMEEHSEDRWLFHVSKKSYMYPLFGHIEHIGVVEGGEEGTIVVMTIGGTIGPKASYLFKMSRYLPFSDVLIVAVYSMLSVDGAESWVKEKMSSK